MDDRQGQGYSVLPFSLLGCVVFIRKGMGGHPPPPPAGSWSPPGAPIDGISDTQFFENFHEMVFLYCTPLVQKIWVGYYNLVIREKSKLSCKQLALPPGRDMLVISESGLYEK